MTRISTPVNSGVAGLAGLTLVVAALACESHNETESGETAQVSAPRTVSTQAPSAHVPLPAERPGIAGPTHTATPAMSAAGAPAPAASTNSASAIPSSSPAADGVTPGSTPAAPVSTPAVNGTTWGSSDWNGVGKPGTPATAANTPAGTPCENFAHVSHLPWGDRPAECPTGDYCLKWDGDPNEQFPNGPEDVIPNAKTWFSNVYAAAAGPIGGVAKIAIVTCKIGNQCLRFYGQDNCHYDLYDPDSNLTLKPPYVGGEDIPFAIKDGHDYLNFRVRLPGSDTVYNFTNVDANAAASPFHARYCPTDAARKSVVAMFDPVEGNQALGCGPDSPYHPLAQLLGETRQPIPYPPPGRSEYDWTYKQKGPKDPAKP